MSGFRTACTYIRSGKLPAYRLAGERSVRVLRKDLLALLERVHSDGGGELEKTPSSYSKPRKSS